MLRLRRLSTDSERQSKVLGLLERNVIAGEFEPWVAVLLAEHSRLRGGAPAKDPLTFDGFEPLLLDPALVELMREQADGPWAVYVEQARAKVWQRRVGAALLHFCEPNVVTGSNILERGVSMSEVLSSEHQWDVAVSYAGKDQAFVSSVVERLEHAGLRVFYAALPEAQSYLWGKELGLVLQTIYRERAAYCLVFVSRDYVESAYTKLEFKSALSRALENDEYVKPIRLDDAELTGLSPSVSFLDARAGRLYANPARLASVIVDALRNRGEFVPGRRLRDPPVVRGIAVRNYFDTILPAVLRRNAKQAIAVDGSVKFDVVGDDAGVWLLTLAPPAASVLRIEPHHDLRSLLLPRHLSIHLTSSQMRAMLEGDFDARKSLIEGNVELEGDLSLLRPTGELFGAKSTGRVQTSPGAVESDQHREWLLDESLRDTFPASDPVSLAQPAARR